MNTEGVLHHCCLQGQQTSVNDECKVRGEGSGELTFNAQKMYIWCQNIFIMSPITWQLTAVFFSTFPVMPFLFLKLSYTAWTEGEEKIESTNSNKNNNNLFLLQLNETIVLLKEEGQFSSLSQFTRFHSSLHAVSWQSFCLWIKSYVGADWVLKVL